MLNVGIIIGSTRPGRKAEAVARWVHGIAAKRSDVSYEVVDIAEFKENLAAAQLTLSPQAVAELQGIAAA
ncbi:MAG: NADPH-dependent oxidoreductase [bacterium]|nr:NADPH-dependent oxidoreductase [bacterium]